MQPFESIILEGFFYFGGTDKKIEKIFWKKMGIRERRLAAFLSFDLKPGDIFGTWVRFELQDDKAVVDYGYLLSGV